MASDYGFYGKTGEYACLGVLPVEKCNCGGEPSIHCRYDDTPGHRDTDYRLVCSGCQRQTTCTDIIMDAIKEWNEHDKKVLVCDACKMASCWHGEFLCDKAKYAGLMPMTVSDLRKLNLENESYWSDEWLKKVQGVS